MPNFCLTVSYDGTDFVGWQCQKNGLSVQEALETALARVLGHPVSCRAAGRTDSGVHARGQVVTFRTDSTQKALLRALRFGANHHLPPGIAVLDAREVPDDFDARYSASGKMYRYQIWNAPVRSPLYARTHWHFSLQLDLDKMRAAAALLLGRHDFASFRASTCDRLTTVRRLKRLEIYSPVADEPILYIDAEATAFLRNMVRILVGTLVEVGRGRLLPERMPALLAARDRTLAGPTAPAHGLILWRVDYGPREAS